MQQWPSKSFLVPRTKSKKWSAFIILYVIEGAVVWPALRSIARLLFLLCACKGKWEGEINRKGVWDMLIFSWHAPRQPSSSHHAALMATGPSDEQGRFPRWWKRNEKENLMSPAAVHHASYHWLCRGSPVRLWDHDLIKQLWPRMPRGGRRRRDNGSGSWSKKGGREHERAVDRCWQLLRVAGHKNPPREFKKGTEACPRAQRAGEGAAAGAVLAPVALGRGSSGDRTSKDGREKGWWETARTLWGRSARGEGWAASSDE